MHLTDHDEEMRSAGQEAASIKGGNTAGKKPFSLRHREVGASDFSHEVGGLNVESKRFPAHFDEGTLSKVSGLRTEEVASLIEEGDEELTITLVDFSCPDTVRDMISIALKQDETSVKAAALLLQRLELWNR